MILLRFMNFLTKQFLLETYFFISFISEIELLSYSKITNNEESKLKVLLGAMSHVGMDEDIQNITISIRRRKTIKLPDAIIAASAISTNSTLVTRNEKDFKHIEGLKLLNPFSSEAN